MDPTTPPVTFVFADWIALYPEFANLSSAMATNYFNLATMIYADSWCNPTACVDGMLQTGLYLLTAHVASIMAPRDATGAIGTGGTPPAIIGRISSATEGSVSVSSEIGAMDAGGPNQPWYMQTQYGYMFWTMMAGMRTFRYVPAPGAVSRFINGVRGNPFYPGRGGPVY